MITQLNVKNFKSWKSTGDMKLAPITGLFGTNSSGKSSILQFLLMLKQTVDSKDQGQVLNFGDRNDPVQLTSYKNMIFNHKVDIPFDFSLKWNDPDLKKINPWSFQAIIIADKSNDITVDRINFLTDKLDNPRELTAERNQDNNDYSLITKHDNKITKTQEDVKIDKFYILPQIRDFSYISNGKGVLEIQNNIRHFTYLNDCMIVFEDMFLHFFYIGTHREKPQTYNHFSGKGPSDVGHSGEHTIPALLASHLNDENNHLEEQVVRCLKKLKLIHEFTIKEIGEGRNIYQVWVQITPDSPEVLLTDVGSGISQVLPILTLLYHVPKGSIVLLEHPELHLHPSAQSELADILIDAMKTRNIQIIFESHSEHLLTRFQLRMAEYGIDAEKGIEAEKDIALYFCRMEDGASQMDPLKLNEYGNITNWPEGFFGDGFGERAKMMDAIIERKQRAIS